MTEKELIAHISSELTQSCMLPYDMPPAEIKRIIDRAKSWAFDNYQYAVEDKLLGIPIEIFENPQFDKDRTIQMPDCVVSVYDVREATGIGIFGQIDRDFGDSKLLGSEIFLSPFQGDNLVYKTALFSYFDLARNYLLETIAFKFNKNTKRVIIHGRKPLRNCVMRLFTKIPDESLFDDELFVRYCLAKAKINLGRTLQVFNFNLPGGVTINFDAIKQDGQTEMELIMQQIDGENQPDWFLQWP